MWGGMVGGRGGVGCGGVGTVPIRGSGGRAPVTCGRVASGGGGGRGALRRAALGVGRLVWGRASGEGLVGVGG